MGMDFSVIGVGHCCQDSICVVEDYPPEDGSTHILSIDDSQGGGAVATALAAAARLGVSCAMMAHLGDDAIGDQIKSGFERCGVDTSLIRRIPGGRSSSSMVMVHPENGSRTKFPFRDALPPLDFDRAQRGALSRAKVVHLDGTRYENAVKAAEIARDAGVTVSLDGCSRQKDNALNLRLAALADILIMNAVYPFAVSGRTDREEALKFMAGLGEKKVVMMTAGSQGSYALIDGRMEHFPAFSVRAVDTTGAGDVFHGAFLARWLESRDIRQCIRFASAVSALKCLKPGGRIGIPTRQEAEAFLAAQSQ